MAQYDVNLRDYLRILRRRKGIVVLVPLLFAVASFAVAIVQAPRPLYRVTAVVRVERAVNFTGLLQELVTFSPVGNVETQAAVIKGFPVMSLAAKKLSLIPEGMTSPELQASPRHLRSVSALQDQVAVKLVENTSLIEVSATASDPDSAVRIANSVAAAFQEDNFATRSRQVREAREFIERQLDEVGARLRDSEEQLKGFKEANKIVVFPDETRESLRRLASLEANEVGLRDAIAEAEEQLRLLRAAKSPPRPTGVSPDGADPTLSRLYGSLSDLSLQRETLLLTLTPSHPQVKHVDAQLGSVRERLREAWAARLTALRGRAAEVHRTVDGLRREQAGIPEADLRMARLEREVKVSERLFSLLREKHQEALIREKEQFAEVSLVRPAVASTRPINPPQALPKAAVGLVVGLVVGFALAFVVETLDTSIGAIQEVESLLDTAVLGVIPHLNVRAELAEEGKDGVGLDPETEEKYAFLSTLFLPESRVVEAFRALRTNLIFSGLEREVKTLMVTSSALMEGKTTVAINLAIAFAQLGKRTLLVEADLRKPFVHHAFGIRKEPGFTDVVIGGARLEEATLSFSDFVLGKAGLEGLLDRPGIDNLYVLTSGQQPPNPTEFLSAAAVANFLAEVRQQYDFVIFDAAPILPVADATILGSRVDGTLMVVRVGTVARAALRRAKTLLEATRARVIGVCLTGVKAELSPDYAEMGYYRYRYDSQAPRLPRTPSQPSLWSRLSAGRLITGKPVTLLILVLLLFALFGSFWALRSGRLTLPFRVAPRPPAAHVVRAG